MLSNTLERLDRCQRSLNDFLEEKRSSFPRFYFIGDDDLLQILGQATRPAVIQAHLKKLFAGIHSVAFDQEERHIVAMNSIDGEVVPLKKQVKARRVKVLQYVQWQWHPFQVRISVEVESWLSELAKEMKNTLKALLVECVSAGRKGQQGGGMDPLKYPSQVLCVAEAILFTERCEEAIAKRSLSGLVSDLEAQLESFTSVDLGSDSDAKVLDLKLKALILDTIHNIDVAKTLVDRDVRSVDDWMWQKQLRLVGHESDQY